MTEGYESENFLVTVRAQVMTRDESTEGWVPLHGGGLANVSIRKRPKLTPGSPAYEYIIFGQRIADQNVILSCVINRDLKYFKVMPTFHHWDAGEQRNGLAFQTAADARAFDKGVVRAYNELIDELAKMWEQNHAIAEFDSVGEDDVFMTLDLPYDDNTNGVAKAQQPSPTDSINRIQPCNNVSSIRSNRNDSHAQHLSQQPQTQYISRSISELSPTTGISTITTTSPTNTTNAGINIEQTPPIIAPSENYSYVILTSAAHDYNYPVADQPAAAPMLNAHRDSLAVKKRNALEAAQALAAQSSPVSLSGSGVGVAGAGGDADHLKHAELLKKAGGAHAGFATPANRIRCRYCHELFNERCNRKGACEFAPDCFRSGFECISGMGCARCMLYHCMSDAEGETPSHPCECVNEAGCTKRWFGLALLSLIVPCLWCYPPLRACHWLGVSCGVCGGKHKPQV